MKYEYKSPRCVDLFAPINRAQITAIANAEKWSLPDDYVEFLCAHNGMEHKWSDPQFLLAYQHSMDLAIDPDDGFKLQFEDWPPSKLHFDFCGFIDELFGLSNPSEFRDLRNAQGHYGFRRFVPPGFLAIGASRYQNYVAICLDGEWKGKVFQWRQPIDPDDPREAHSVAHFMFIADSFRAFWDGLVEVPNDALDG